MRYQKLELEKQNGGYVAGASPAAPSPSCRRCSICTSKNRCACSAGVSGERFIDVFKGFGGFGDFDRFDGFNFYDGFDHNTLYKLFHDCERFIVAYYCRIHDYDTCFYRGNFSGTDISTDTRRERNATAIRSTPISGCNGDDVACPAANGTQVCTPIDLMLNKTTCEIRGCPKGQAPIHVGTNQTLTCVPLTILSGGLLPSMWQFAVLHPPAPNCLPYKDTVACSNSNGTQYACVHYTQLANVSGGGSAGLQCTATECKAAGELFCNGTCLNVDDVVAVGPDGQCRLHPKPQPEPANAPEVIVKKPKAAQMHADYTAVNILIMVFLGILALLAVLAVIVYFALKRSAKNKKKKKSTSSEHTYGSDPEPPVKKKKCTKSDKEDNLDPAFLTIIDDKASHAASAIRSTH
ncbi:unnamed protein product, partial [Mesorhabditis spiculigera]